MSKHNHDVPEELLSSLLANYKKAEDLMGENGLLTQLTKLLVEKSLDAGTMPQSALPTATPSLALTSRLSNLERPRPSANETEDDRWGGLKLSNLPMGLINTMHPTHRSDREAQVNAEDQSPWFSAFTFASNLAGQTTSRPTLLFMKAREKSIAPDPPLRNASARAGNRG